MSIATPNVYLNIKNEAARELPSACIFEGKRETSLMNKLKKPFEQLTDMERESLHDQLVRCLVKIFRAHDFRVSYSVKGRRHKVRGDSGIIYYPTVVAQKEPVAVVCDVRTRGQRGMGRKTDRGAVQLFKAQLDDLDERLGQPRGIIVNPHGIERDARMLAEHFRIDAVSINTETLLRILGLDLTTSKERIIKEAVKSGMIL